ncbi:RcpC/CpaB family pilus assembly protein [Pseudarthrobacter sulfonivorans]|uniref:Flp pilus assembly protein CpaB n=1 Tax=Pseudarthrobacter sulfonivorans TaxID=121292 RepID=UPI002861C52C|nr:RcpC/CpaB family pilus assembly protein [Pseudarthrobacter sulfonivorans]MDR6413614.1 pilus assembly protein CpaB [Pseudarthrobacter sulfonivorans]
MKSRLLAGTAAIALAIVGALLVIFYAQGADQRAMATTKPVDVLVVNKAIPAGTPVNEMAASLVIEKVPAAGVADTALSTLDNAAGTVSAVALVPGEQLLAERLIAPEAVKSEGAVKIPAGLQEVSFEVEPKRIVGGRIEVGDHVGFFLSFEKGANKANLDDATSQLTVRKALVTAVQRAPQTAPAEKPAEGAPDPQDTTLPEGSLMLTVAVNDINAGKIVFASEFGRLWLTKEPLNAKNNGPRIERKDVVYK